ncbi:hypothetical protein C453_14206 [Haloferax elongans ATCC BAA-1513]|uniref:Membrane-spanning protein n=1 Tax=Haloferax elongans ATCC BAA-1513 TaxID=1230453 RepID=M0HF86_HALEO|nr:hypothetical protein [Haloferax elongans]ELZ83165.1 hypothetical protein C453_14206 [Haloferax elongans ATCC BAA-1513]
MRIRDKLRISTHRQQQLSRAMQVILIGLVFIGLDRGDIGIVVNASVGLGVTYLPAILERDYRIPMDTGLTLWISSAAFLHALGTVGLPGSETNFYAGIWWWDHLTHALSSSVVAGAGYATVRALDEHTDAIYLPPRFMFVFILLFVLAFGVFWEVIEFAISGVAELAGTGSVLTQYGLDDTLMDLVFDAVGGLIVALWGTAHLSDVVGAIQTRLERTPR